MIASLVYIDYPCPLKNAFLCMVNAGKNLLIKRHFGPFLSAAMEVLWKKT